LPHKSSSRSQPRAVDAQPARVTDVGALAAFSGERTGRVPQDKRIVDNEVTNRAPVVTVDGADAALSPAAAFASQASKDIWWGPVNIPLDEHSWDINRNRAIDYLNTRPRLYVVDGFAGWDPKYRIKVRVVACRAYHALFMRNMLMRPQDQADVEEFEKEGPDFHIFNAGEFPANPLTKVHHVYNPISLHERHFNVISTQSHAISTPFQRCLTPFQRHFNAV